MATYPQPTILPIFNSSSFPQSSSGTQGVQGSAGSTGYTGGSFTFTDSVFLATNAGETNQGDYGIAIGYRSGETDQGVNAIALGRYAGETDQGQGSIAIGTGAGQGRLNQNAIAIGQDASFLGGGTYSIAIGSYANAYSTSSIVINATGTFLDGSTGLYVAPIQGFQGATYGLYYDTSTNQISWGTNTNIPTDYTMYGNVDITTFGTTTFTLSSGLIEIQDYYQFNSHIVMSANGKYQLVNPSGTIQYPLYLSNNYGTTFNESDSGSDYFNCICINSDGKYQYGGTTGGLLYSSSNWGANWSSTTIVNDSSIKCICCNASGSNLCIGTYDLNTSIGTLQISKDYGTSFTDVSPNNNQWNRCVISGSGQYLMAFNLDETTNLYESSDFGSSWSVNSYGFTFGLQNIAISYTGKYRIATCYSRVI